jgi:hypothetical protein
MKRWPPPANWWQRLHQGFHGHENFLLIVLLILGGTAGGVTVARTVPGPPPFPSSPPPAEAVTLPDLTYTTGAVLTTNVNTVCQPGYTRTVRVSLTIAERDQVDTHYHWTYQPGAQEMDHLIPLELGGNNGVTNIWPQPIAEAHIKDRLENELHAKACAGKMSLLDAQACIRTDWYACARQEGIIQP